MESILGPLFFIAIVALIIVQIVSYIKKDDTYISKNNSLLSIVGIILTVLLPVIGFVISLREFLLKGQKVYVKFIAIIGMIVNIAFSLYIFMSIFGWIL